MNAARRKVSTFEFFSRNPVFSLEQAAEELTSGEGHDRIRERLRYHLDRGNLKLLARGLYAVVPPGIPPERFQPDAIQVAAVERPDAIFCYHSALELLGAAHSTWSDCTIFTERRRRNLQLGNRRIRFLQFPIPMSEGDARFTGLRRIEYRGNVLTCTGPERTLIEGFRRPALVGGFEELLISAGGFTTLDLDLLTEILSLYATSKLWAATGWFLEHFKNSFHVSEEDLNRLEKRIPASPQYLERRRRGGKFLSRWNLIIPPELTRLGEPDES